MNSAVTTDGWNFFCYYIIMLCGLMKGQGYSFQSFSLCTTQTELPFQTSIVILELSFSDLYATRYLQI